MADTCDFFWARLDLDHENFYQILSLEGKEIAFFLNMKLEEMTTTVPIFVYIKFI